jgi:uncharacterized DUF497 family protein
MNQDISFDPHKSQRNEVERGLPFTLVAGMEWDSALLREDTRKDYGERRFFVLGLIHGRLHAAVFTPRDDKVHVISLRKANSREVTHYEQTQNSAAQPRH